jgi:hypothetical protein
MTVLNYGDLSINGAIVGYEGQVEITPGSRKRNFFPQVGANKIITSDISTDMSKIVIPIRVTPENLADFKVLFENGDNNTITFRDQSFTACAMEEEPAAKDMDLVDYVFYGDPAS